MTRAVIGAVFYALVFYSNLSGITKALVILGAVCHNLDNLLITNWVGSIRSAIARLAEFVSVPKCDDETRESFRKDLNDEISFQKDFDKRWYVLDQIWLFYLSLELVNVAIGYGLFKLYVLLG